MRLIAVGGAVFVGFGLGVLAAWFEPFETLAIVAPLIAGTAAALALQVGDRWTRTATLIGGIGGWAAGLLVNVGTGRALDATGAGQISAGAIGRAGEATLGMALALAVGIGVGVYLRTAGAFEPERRGRTMQAAVALGAVIAVMVVALFATRALVGLG